MSDEHIPERYCHECKTEFEDSFELIDHLLPEDEEFDPYYILPNGFKLMLGSMLRYIHGYADKPEKIKKLAQSTYITLFAAEMEYESVGELVEDMVVSQEMQDIDLELERLLRGPNDYEGGE
jgi:uncharacterized protein YjaG (DUF416 family)